METPAQRRERYLKEKEKKRREQDAKWSAAFAFPAQSGPKISLSGGSYTVGPIIWNSKPFTWTISSSNTTAIFGPPAPVGLNQTQMLCTGKELELVPNSLVAYRRFSLFSGGLVGASGQPWTAGENVARCLFAPGEEWHNKPGFVRPTNVDHTEVPFEECSCGFYAYHGPANAAATGANAAATGIWGWPYGRPAVEAAVEFYGRVLIGSKGLRAQKARVLAVAPAEREASPYGVSAADPAYSPLPPWTEHALGGLVAQGIEVLPNIEHLFNRHKLTSDL